MRSSATGISSAGARGPRRAPAASARQLPSSTSGAGRRQHETLQVRRSRRAGLQPGRAGARDRVPVAARAPGADSGHEQVDTCARRCQPGRIAPRFARRANSAAGDATSPAEHDDTWHCRGVRGRRVEAAPSAGATTAGSRRGSRRSQTCSRRASAPSHSASAALRPPRQMQTRETARARPVRACEDPWRGWTATPAQTRMDDAATRPERHRPCASTIGPSVTTRTSERRHVAPTLSSADQQRRCTDSTDQLHMVVVRPVGSIRWRWGPAARRPSAVTTALRAVATHPRRSATCRRFVARIARASSAKLPAEPALSRHASRPARRPAGRTSRRHRVEQRDPSPSTRPPPRVGRERSGPALRPRRHASERCRPSAIADQSAAQLRAPRCDDG